MKDKVSLPWKSINKERLRLKYKNKKICLKKTNFQL